MPQPPEQLWQAIITLRAAFQQNGIHAADISLETMAVCPTDNDCICIIDSDGVVTLSLDTQTVDFSSDNILTSAPDKHLYSHYIQSLLVPLQAHKLRRAIVIIHCAQTLDGKMATLNDHSQWIGNKHNIIHAHRMRALTDSIMVGAHTYAVDKPQLTVRHVDGEDPTRLVLTRRDSIDGSDNNVHCVGNSDGSLRTVLEGLYEEGIHSVFLEGGALTLGAFIQQQLVDTLQIHIAPMLLGSGKQITLPTVDKVTDAIQFKAGEFIPVGDEIMFVGTPDYTATTNKNTSPGAALNIPGLMD